MFNPIKFYEDLQKKKAVDDPRVRQNDPVCWQCLSDEQRDTINEWYMELLIGREHKNSEEDTASSWAGIIGVSPFAFFQAMRYSHTFLELLLNCAAALAAYAFIFILFSHAYRAVKQIRPLPMSKLGSFGFHLAAFGASFFITYCVFSLVI